MSNPIFSRQHYEFLAALVAAMKPSSDKAPILCQADETTEMAWRHGQRSLRQDMIDGLCAKFYIDNPKSFNEERFRRACK